MSRCHTRNTKAAVLSPVATTGAIRTPSTRPVEPATPASRRSCASSPSATPGGQRAWPGWLRGEGQLRTRPWSTPPASDRTLTAHRELMSLRPAKRRAVLRKADAPALRAGSADLVEFGSNSRPVDYAKGESVLKIPGRFGNLGGTSTAAAVRGHYDGHDRVLIVTDEQVSPGGGRGGVFAAVPAHVPTYTWNLEGYAAAHAPSGTPGRHAFGGLTDAAFRMVSLLESGRSADWPWRG